MALSHVTEDLPATGHKAAATSNRAESAEWWDGPLSQRLHSLKGQTMTGCSLQLSELFWLYFTLHDLYEIQDM